MFRQKHHNLYHDKVADKHRSHVESVYSAWKPLTRATTIRRRAVKLARYWGPVVIPFEGYFLFCKRKSDKLTLPQEKEMPSSSFF